MEDFIQRVINEQKELEEKTTKLGAFLLTEKYQELEPEMRLLLAQQSAFMGGYNMILKRRIDLLTN